MARILPCILHHILPLVIMPPNMRRILEVQNQAQETETPLGEVSSIGRAIKFHLAICNPILWSCSTFAHLVESEGLLSLNLLHSIHHPLHSLLCGHRDENFVENFGKVIRKVAQGGIKAIKSPHIRRKSKVNMIYGSIILYSLYQ